MSIKERLIDYSNEIAKGNIIACKKHKQACIRFLNDIKREDTDEFPFVWIEEEAQKIVDWFSYLRHSKGILAGKPIRIDENNWQLFNNANIYGWYNRDTGYRRFTKGYIQVGRKNAKSQNMAGIGLYEDSYTSTKNKEVNETYTAGTKRDQSQLIFKEAKLMLNESPLKDRFNILRNEIIHKKTQSFMKALSKEDGQKGDGTNPGCFLLDEYHQHETTDFYDLADSGMKARREPLLLIITTAGKNLNSPCYQQEYKYCSNILNGSIKNESYYVMINELDKDDDISDERNWIKANPIVMTYPEGIKGMRESFDIAKDVPEKMSTFLTKNLNVWIQQRDNGYMDMNKWKECGEEIDYSILKGLECIAGVDLSAKVDLTSIGFIFKLENGKYLVLGHSFMPEDTLQQKMKTDKVPYDLWVKQKHITLTPGAVVDYNFIMQYIKDFELEFGCKIKEICADPWNATQFMQDMESEGYLVVEIRQGIRTLGSPTKNFREQVYSKNVIHDKNPVITYAVGNAITKKDHNENIMLDKAKSVERIDPIAAVINSHVRAMLKVLELDLNKHITSDDWSL